MRSGLIAVVVLSSCLSYAPFALAANGPAIVDVEGKPVASDAVLVKGKPVALAAVLATTDAGAPVVWKAEPDGVVAVADAGPGRAVVTALRDWFDERPRREPTVRVTACAGATCASASFSCVPDVAGVWPTKLEVGGLFGGSEVRELVFVQRGRAVAFDPEPMNKPDARRTATLRLEGDTLRLVQKGSILTRFDGALADRDSGSGNWASSWGFSGVWTAARRK